MPGHSYRDLIYENYAAVQAPDWYRRGDAVEDAWKRVTLRRLRPWLPPEKAARVLDLGCGNGRLLSALSLAGYRDLLGVDCSPESVRLARARGFCVEQRDLGEFCRASHREFDLICAFDVIEHFTKSELVEVLRSIYDCMALGGVLLLQTPNAMSPWAGQYRYGDFTHEVAFTPECLRNLLRMCGFREIEIREVRPVVHGAKSAVRAAAWKALWLASAAWHLVESGDLCGGIYTKNMLLRARKGRRIA
jgi:SAM-dependent methyltransferase